MLGIIHNAVVLLASSSSDSDSSAFGYIFLLSGFVFYAYVFLRYRNVNKRHHYETETEAEKLNLEKSDDRIKSLTNLSNSRMHGANNTVVRGSGGLSFSMDQLSTMTDKLNPLIEQFEKHSGGGDPKT